MTENIGNLYVRTESEEEFSNNGNNSPKMSTSLSSLKSLRDTFKRSESRASQTSLANTSIKNEAINNGSDATATKTSKFSISCKI